MPKELIENNSDGDVKKLASFRISKNATDMLNELVLQLKKDVGFKVSQADAVERAIKELHAKVCGKK